MLCPIEYYLSPDSMWTPPEPGTPYSVAQICAMLVREDSPAAPVISERLRKAAAIAAQQEIETAASLLRVATDLPEGSQQPAAKGTGDAA